MKIRAINSSVIARVGYDEQQARLRVLFVSGRVYDYFMVPQAVFAALLSASSPGKYLNEQVKDRYREQRVRDD